MLLTLKLWPMTDKENLKQPLTESLKKQKIISQKVKKNE